MERIDREAAKLRNAVYHLVLSSLQSVIYVLDVGGGFLVRPSTRLFDARL